MHDIAMKIQVSGRVQGVWFRAWTQEEALKLGLRGWVRNEPDGTVLALAAGPEARVRELLAELHRGPPNAIVRDVSFEETALPDISGFEITH